MAKSKKTRKARKTQQNARGNKMMQTDYAVHVDYPHKACWILPPGEIRVVQQGACPCCGEHGPILKDFAGLDGSLRIVRMDKEHMGHVPNHMVSAGDTIEIHSGDHLVLFTPEESAQSPKPSFSPPA